MTKQTTKTTNFCIISYSVTYSTLQSLTNTAIHTTKFICFDVSAQCASVVANLRPYSNSIINHLKKSATTQHINLVHHTCLQNTRTLSSKSRSMDQDTKGVIQIELLPTTNKKIASSQHVTGTFNFLPQGTETMPTSCHVYK